jgi:hypothetical protein
VAVGAEGAEVVDDLAVAQAERAVQAHPHGVAAGAAVERVGSVMPEQLVVVGAAGHRTAGRVGHLPEHARDRGPAPMADLLAAAGRLAPVARLALDVGRRVAAQLMVLAGSGGRRGQGGDDQDRQEGEAAHAAVIGRCGARMKRRGPRAPARYRSARGTPTNVV